MRLLLGIGCAGALLGGGPAPAETTAHVVARLVTSVCMPMIRTGVLQPDSLPPGGKKLSIGEAAKLGMASDLADWRYDTADDYVIVQLRPDGCDVVTGATGGPNFLETLRRVVSERYSKPVTIDRGTDDSDPDVSHIAYWVDLPPGGPADGPPAEGLAITYTKASARPPKRTFYVGVLPATRRPD